jgi:hypothetical protein
MAEPANDQTKAAQSILTDVKALNDPTDILMTWDRLSDFGTYSVNMSFTKGVGCCVYLHGRGDQPSLVFKHCLMYDMYIGNNVHVLSFSENELYEKYVGDKAVGGVVTALVENGVPFEIKPKSICDLLGRSFEVYYFVHRYTGNVIDYKIYTQ